MQLWMTLVMRSLFRSTIRTRSPRTSVMSKLAASPRAICHPPCGAYCGYGSAWSTQVRTRRDVCWLKDGLLHFATVYRAPGDNLTTFLSELSKDVLQFQNVVIGGDFNVHMRANGDKNLDENGRMVFRWCRDHGLTVLNKTALCRGRFSRVELKPHAEKVERSTVDYVLISNDLLPSVLDLCIDEAGQFSSDHRPLVLTLRRPRTPVTKKRVVGHYAWRVFTATEEQTENFTEGLEHAMDGFIRGMLSADAAVEAARATSAAHVESLLLPEAVDLHPDIALVVVAVHGVVLRLVDGEEPIGAVEPVDGSTRRRSTARPDRYRPSRCRIGNMADIERVESALAVNLLPRGWQSG